MLHYIIIFSMLHLVELWDAKVVGDVHVMQLELKLSKISLCAQVQRFDARWTLKGGGRYNVTCVLRQRAK
jgi:hypothetical protein